MKEAGPGEPVEILGFDRPPPRGRAVARRRARAPGEGHRREARRAAPPRAAGAALVGRRCVARDALRADAGRRRPGPQHRPQGRRAGLRRGAARRARQDPAPRGPGQRHPHGRRRDHRERRQPRVGLECARGRLQRAAERRGAAARRARRRRHPHLPRHLQAHRGHRAGARRDALAGHDRGDPRRGRGARAVQGVAARHDRRLHGHERRRAPRARASASSATAR